MNPERWQRLKAIVADALEHDSPADRTALVSRECADDAGLLREAETLLRDAETILRDSDDALEDCAETTATVLGHDRPSQTGHRIGAYVVVRELGRGGMGTVYLAARADGYFEKQVAIKVLKPSGNTGELLHRFRAEREVLASLDHPNIAGIFDAGTTEGEMPYFVMEYVPGIAVTAFIAERQLSIRQRLELFLKICAAVEAAHRKRIVHRDLKPSNILVTEEAEPKLLDFGIAKLLEPAGPLEKTATGQQRLTPICASPEQAVGEDVTTASDIYALGTLLYEMLTGQAPHRFSGRRPSPEEVAQVICNQAPIRPSLVVSDGEEARALRGELDAIVLFAMHKEPSKRYPSVSALAMDIRRYLANEPVQALPQTRTYHLRSFVRRNKVGAISLTLGAAAVICAIGFTAMLNRRENLSPKEAANKVAPGVVSTVASIPEKSIAVLPFDNFDTSDENTYFVDGVQDDILTDLAKVEDLKVIGRTSVAQYRQGPRDIHEIGRSLGVAYILEGSVRKLGDRVRVNVQLIDAQSDFQVWAEHYDRKIDDLFSLQSELSQTIVAQLKGKLSPREKAAIEKQPTADMQAYDLYLRARGSFVGYQYDKAIEQLNQAINRDPNFALAYCLLAEAHLYVNRFNGDPSPERLGKAKAAADTALRLSPDLPESHLAQAQYYYYGLRDYEKAQIELATTAPSQPRRAKFFDLMALTDRRLGRWKESLRNGEKAVELDPYDPYIATEVIQTYLALRKYPEAEKLASRTIVLINPGAGPLWVLRSQSFLAQGELARARESLEAAPANSETKNFSLAQIAAYERDFATAVRQLELARKAPMATAATSGDFLAVTIARAEGSEEGAKAAFEKAREKLEGVLRNRPDDPEALSELGLAYAGLGRKEDALRVSRRAVELLPTWRDAMEGPLFATMLAEVYAWVEDHDAALEQLAALVTRPAGPSYGELKFDPAWDDLRSDPRFDKIIAKAAEPPVFD